MHRDENGQAVIGWIALIVSIAALVLAWTAFNRTGENLEDLVRDEVQQQLRIDTTPEPQPELDTTPEIDTDTETDTDTDTDTTPDNDTPDTP